MSKNIAYCSDGTWDTEKKKTNVYKLFKALSVDAAQTTIYDDGVGSDGLAVQRLLGGAFGLGLWDEVKEGYTKMAHLYEAGDPLYLFGFSRGAYTARSVAGMILACGLPTKTFTDELVETAFAAYRRKDDRQELLAQLAGFGMVKAKITMVGVWDTVGSLGIPGAIGGIDPLLYGFLDTGLHPNVLNAYHAMAIDERRIEFPVTRWTTEPAPGQNIEQVWFTGVHSDVGGGEGVDLTDGGALSDVTLAWMMSKASALGLRFDPAMAALYSLPMDPKYAMDKLHTSWNVGWGFPKHRAIAAGSVLANSVMVRCQHDSGYRPSNLHLVNGVPVGYELETVVGEAPKAVMTGKAAG